MIKIGIISFILDLVVRGGLTKDMILGLRPELEPASEMKTKEQNSLGLCLFVF